MLDTPRPTLQPEIGQPGDAFAAAVTWYRAQRRRLNVTITRQKRQGGHR
jgi:hypothetical protein